MICDALHAQRPRTDGNTGFSPELFHSLTRGVPEVQKLGGDGVGVEENRIVPMTELQAPLLFCLLIYGHAALLFLFAFLPRPSQLIPQKVAEQRRVQ